MKPIYILRLATTPQHHHHVGLQEIQNRQAGMPMSSKSTWKHLQATWSPPWLQVQTGLLAQLLIQPNTKDCSRIRLKVIVSWRGGGITCTDLWHQPKAVNKLPGEWKATASLSLLLKEPETFPQPVFSKCIALAKHKPCILCALAKRQQE